MAISTSDWRGGAAQVEGDEAVLVRLVHQNLRRVARPAPGHRVDDAERFKQRICHVHDGREKTSPVTRTGNVIDQNRRNAVAPSTLAASSKLCGTSCSPAIKKAML